MNFYSCAKRFLDLAVSLTVLVVVWPILLITAIAIKLYDGGPVLADIPPRGNKKNKMFKLYKFRSMMLDADKILRTDPKYKKAYALYKKQGYKLKDDEDPRITPIGRIIRRWDIDELPQMFNVIKGDMSIVGPRAYYQFELKDYRSRGKEWAKLLDKIATVKPGITGVWQTSGRNEIPTFERLKLGAWYAEKKSILLDLKVMVKTPLAIIIK